MGFKDLEKFKLTLLAKQVWRLHTNPNFHFPKTFKARHFPSSIWFTSTGFNPSYAWRSILWSRHLLQANVRRRVGDENIITPRMMHGLEEEEQERLLLQGEPSIIMLT